MNIFYFYNQQQNVKRKGSLKKMWKVRKYRNVLRTVQFSSVASNSLQPHEPRHARLPCPSPTPRAYSTYSLFSFTFIKRLFGFSSLSAIRVLVSAYLRLFLPAILIPACAASSPAFLMMYSAYKLNKQGDNIQPWYTPFPIWNQSVVPCPVLTVASWPGHRFLKRQVRWSGIPTPSEFSTVYCDPHSQRLWHSQ